MGWGCRVAFGLASLLSVACTPEVFSCADDESCNGGTCEADGYCSFADGGCPSGRRYGTYAPEGTAGRCIDPPQGPGTSDAPSSGVDSSSSTTSTEASTSSPDLETGVETSGPDPITSGQGDTAASSSSETGAATSSTGASDDSSTGGPIPVCDILDDFDDGMLDAGWGASEPVFVEEVGGMLQIEIDPPLRYVMVGRDALADVSGGAFAAELTHPPPIISVAQAIELLSGDGGESVSYLVVGTTLSARHYVGETFEVVDSMPFDPDEHRHLRLRGEDGMVVFETSADGLSFDVHTTLAAPFDLGSVRPRLRAGNWEPIDASEVVAFDDVRLCGAL